jgi:DNA replication protein DnaC
MKTLSEVMDSNTLPKFEEGDKISAIMKKGRPVFCSERSPNGVVCPMCGSEIGYKVRDGNNLWWACASSDCIERNCANNMRSKSYIPTIPLSEMGVPKRLLEANFNDWKHSEKLKEELKHFVIRHDAFLTIGGDNGVGKTYAAVAMLKEFYNVTKEIPIFVNISNLYQTWKEDEEHRTDLKHKLRRTNLLVLDDLGVREPTEAFLDFLYSVINNRYNDMKGTLITTNLSSAEISECFGNRIYSRLLSGKLIKLDGNDLRLRQRTDNVPTKHVKISSVA